MRKRVFCAAMLGVVLAAVTMSCQNKTPAESAPGKAAVSGPGSPQSGTGGAPVDGDFPQSGLRAVFRGDFPFVTVGGEVDAVSAPPARAGCRVKLLCAGEERLKWRLDLLSRAKESIRVQTYIFTNDDAGKKIAELFKARRKDGRLVKLTVDCYNKFMPADRLMYNDLELAGIQVMGLEPVALTGTAEKKFFNVADVNMRFHEKYFVVDGQAAIVGGTNIANEYYSRGDQPENKWRDQDVLLVGPVVADVARAFDDNYEYFKLRREGRLPTNRAAWFARAWWEIAGTTPPPIDNTPPQGRLELGAEKFDADSATVRFIRHRPRRQEDYIFQAYLHLIESASQSILIENAYFVPNRTLLLALMKAAKRGVKVTVITNSLATNDVPAMQVLSRYAYLGLVENGVAVYEWQGLTPGQGCLHTKAAVFDGQVTVIGSCNLDPRSLGINSEDVVLIDSSEVAARLADYVEKTDLPVSLRITKAQAQQWHSADAADEKFKLTFGKTLEDWF